MFSPAPPPNNVPVEASECFYVNIYIIVDDFENLFILCKLCFNVRYFHIDNVFFYNECLKVWAPIKLSPCALHNHMSKTVTL